MSLKRVCALVYGESQPGCKCSNSTDACRPQETCNGTVCMCGSSKSCDGKITGSYCDADNSLCKCAADVDACPGGVECKLGVCGKFL